MFHGRHLQACADYLNQRSSQGALDFKETGSAATLNSPFAMSVQTQSMRQKQWIQQRFAMHLLYDLGAQAQQRGLQTLVMGGFSSLLKGDIECGERRMGDIDLWVDPSQRTAWHQLLLEQGYQVKGCVYRKQAVEIDLHRHPLNDFRGDAWDALVPLPYQQIWQKAQQHAPGLLLASDQDEALLVWVHDLKHGLDRSDRLLLWCQRVQRMDAEARKIFVECMGKDWQPLMQAGLDLPNWMSTGRVNGKGWVAFLIAWRLSGPALPFFLPMVVLGLRPVNLWRYLKAMAFTPANLESEFDGQARTVWPRLFRWLRFGFGVMRAWLSPVCAARFRPRSKLRSGPHRLSDSPPKPAAGG